MPLDAPRSLERQTVTDILSYWYSQHGYSVSKKELSGDIQDLKDVRITPQKSPAY